MMTDIQVSSKVELLAGMDRSWKEAASILDQLTPLQMNIIKDHLCHLTAWERSEISLLHGHPRHRTLGIEEAVYFKSTDDEINAILHQQHKDIPLDEALSQFRATHQSLMSLLQSLTEHDVQKSYRDYLSGRHTAV